MSCKYSEHVISCGHDGGFTVGTRKPSHVHSWELFWHMGYVIGRECACGKQQHMSKRWCAKQESEIGKPKPAAIPEGR